jgi:hypothetical protein
MCRTKRETVDGADAHYCAINGQTDTYIRQLTTQWFLQFHLKTEAEKASETMCFKPKQDAAPCPTHASDFLRAGV